MLGWRGVLLVATGEAVPVVLGLALLVFPVVGLYVVWRELRFGLAAQRLSEELEEAGELPADDRRDRAAADATFAVRKAAVEAAPEDWRAWFGLASVYDAAGDRRRARAAMRTAIRHHARPPGQR